MGEWCEKQCETVYEPNKGNYEVQCPVVWPNSLKRYSFIIDEQLFQNCQFEEMNRSAPTPVRNAPRREDLRLN